MSDELSNATRIAALEADVVRLTAELQGERDDLAEKCKEYGDALVEETKLTSRIAALTTDVIRLTSELQSERDDLAAVYKAKCKLIDACDALQTAFDERNAYAERLLAENVRLSNEAETERERCGVLEREVARWRSEFPLFRVQRKGVKVNAIEVGDEQPTVVEMPECDETDTRHALDAAKFRKEQNDG